MRNCVFLPGVSAIALSKTESCTAWGTRPQTFGIALIPTFGTISSKIMRKAGSEILAKNLKSQRVFKNNFIFIFAIQIFFFVVLTDFITPLKLKLFFLRQV